MSPDFFFIAAGILRNNSDAINVAKSKFCTPLLWTEHAFFYGNVFQGFSFADKMSLLLLNFLKKKKKESYSLSGNDCKGNGGDFFVLESFNRNVKWLLPSGLPDDQGWIRACRNVKRITKLNEILIY